MLILILSAPSFLLALFYSLFLYIFKSRFPSRVRVFFISFFIAVTIFSLIFWLEKQTSLTFFGIGVLACFFGLVYFHALPYMEPWTLSEAKFKLRGTPFHHSFMGILVFIALVVPILLWDTIFPIHEPFSLVVSFFDGGVVFAISSQIPEIIEHRTFFFWKHAV